MKAALAAVVLLASGGCVRAGESAVREQAAAAFNCADYALTVVEVGPDVYRASGCGQELVYACAPVHGAADDGGDEAPVSCERTAK